MHCELQRTCGIHYTNRVSWWEHEKKKPEVTAFKGADGNHLHVNGLWHVGCTDTAGLGLYSGGNADDFWVLECLPV